MVQRKKKRSHNLERDSDRGVKESETVRSWKWKRDGLGNESCTRNKYFMYI